MGYKIDKEAFVSGMSGSSITHINLLSLVALASVSLYAAIQTRTRILGFFPSWQLLVLPLLLSMTLFANRPFILLVLLSLPTGLLLWYLPPRENGTPLPSNQPSLSSSSTARSPVRIYPLPALTTYRAHMMLMTVLAILAVDFPVFPRSLAKCETFGVSLMDLGVGSFVFSQGIVSAIPLIKDPVYLTSPIIPKLLRVTRKSLPIIVLGLIRVVLVKGTDYPEHETEYGRHWNFFITLALLPIMQVLIHPLLLRFPIALVGIILGIGQQIALSHFGLGHYLLSAPRNSLISANKEGIISLPGYLAIHILGLSIGTIALPPSPSFFRRQQKALNKHYKRRNSNTTVDPNNNSNLNIATAPRQIEKTATELCSYTIIWWTFLGLVRFFEVDGRWEGLEGGISRRMANLSYILWVTAFNTFFLLSYLVILDMWIFSGRKAVKYHKNANAPPPPPPPPPSPSIQIGNPPPLLELINKHSLSIFLLANVLTGLINLTIPTMYISDIWALIILVCYSFIVCGLPRFVIDIWRKK